MDLRILKFSMLSLLTTLSLSAGDINNVSGTVFTDTNKDGIYNNEEAGLSNVHLRFFHDINNDGHICPHVGDILIAEIDTDGNGDYTVTDIPDGNYLMVIMKNDLDIPSGSKLTTASPRKVIVNGGTVQDVDFAFLPSTTPQANTHDYGDAPDTYPGSDGTTDDARHRVVAGVHLGSFIDVDGDGSAGDDENSADARSDDQRDNDDEDGVQLLDPLIPGESARVRVLAHEDSEHSATLRAFFDLDGNNHWYDEGDEVLINDSSINDGVNLYTINIPASATNGDDGKSFVRFKYWDDRGSGGTCCFAEADSGEVEDYEINIGASYTISGTVFNDADGNGSQNGTEAGLANVKVGLYKDLDDDGVIDVTDVVNEIDTDANGDYSFTVPPNLDISKGNYLVIVDTEDGDIPSEIKLTGVNPVEAMMNNENLIDKDFPFSSKPIPAIDIETATNTEDADTQATAVQLTAGDTVTWSYVVQNIGEIALENIVVTDDQEGVITCPKDILAINETMTCTEKTGVASEGNYTNIASVVATEDCGTTECQDVNDTDPSNYVAEALVLASLGDYVWYDLNKNGEQDANESGVPNVTVTLYKDCNTTVGSMQTDANGLYLFSNLEPTAYCVGFSDIPTDYVVTAKNQGANTAMDSDVNLDSNRTGLVTLVAGDNDLTWDMGIYTAKVSLGDYVWYDLNKDGQQNHNETGVPNVTVTLYQSNCSTAVIGVDPVSTDGQGKYLFSDLNAGEYCVGFTNIPDGYAITDKDSGDNGSDSDVDATTANTGTITLPVATDDLTWDMGIYPLAKLGDRVWLDTNKDGIQDSSEVGVEDVNVTLLQNCTTELMSTRTDANGNYLFINLKTGNYCVKFSDLPSGYFITNVDTTSDNNDSDANQVTGKTAITDLTAGEDDRRWDMGLYRLASLGDRVWEDDNKNGIQDTNESGVENVKVTLIKDCTTAVNSTRTNANGNYIFENIDPGEYCVEFGELPAGYLITDRDIGIDDDKDSDVDSVTNRTAITELISNEYDMSWGAGIYKKATIGNRVWEDSNKNGVQDINESGVESVTVILYEGDCTTTVNTALTDENGSYIFTNLDPAEYCIGFSDLPADYLFTTEGVAVENNNSDANSTTGLAIKTELISGENDMSWDAGIYKKASLGDFIWYDSNNNGKQDLGEQGVSDVNVTLFGADCNSVVSSMRTDNNGFYLFENLDPARYCLEFSELPSGYIITSQNNTDDNADSDANPLTGKIETVELNSGEDDRSWDMGIRTRPVAYVPVVGVVPTPEPKVENTPPVAENIETPLVDNPGGDVRVPVGLDVRDVEDGVPSTVTIQTLPEGGVLYYDGQVVVAGQEIPNFDSSLLTVNPENGTQAIVFNYTTTDSEGLVSESARVRMPFGAVGAQEGFNIGDDSTLANEEGAVTTLFVLENDTVGEGGIISLVNLQEGEILWNGGTAVGGTNIITTDELHVDGEGTWRVHDDGTVTFTAEDGFEGTPTPVYYVVMDAHGNQSNVAELRITTPCTCETYKSTTKDSVSTLGDIGMFMMVLAQMLTLLFFFRKEEQEVK